MKFYVTAKIANDKGIMNDTFGYFNSYEEAKDFSENFVNSYNVITRTIRIRTEK